MRLFPIVRVDFGSVFRCFKTPVGVAQVARFFEETERFEFLRRIVCAVAQQSMSSLFARESLSAITSALVLQQTSDPVILKTPT